MLSDSPNGLDDFIQVVVVSSVTIGHTNVLKEDTEFIIPKTRVGHHLAHHVGYYITQSGDGSLSCWEGIASADVY